MRIKLLSYFWNTGRVVLYVGKQTLKFDIEKFLLNLPVRNLLRIFIE